MCLEHSAMRVLRFLFKVDDTPKHSDTGIYITLGSNTHISLDMIKYLTEFDRFYAQTVIGNLLQRTQLKVM